MNGMSNEHWLILILKYFIWSGTQMHIGISTMLINIAQWPKRMGHETDTVYLTSSPIFCSKKCNTIEKKINYQ